MRFVDGSSEVSFRRQKSRQTQTRTWGYFMLALFLGRSFGRRPNLACIYLQHECIECDFFRRLVLF